MRRISFRAFFLLLFFVFPGLLFAGDDTGPEHWQRPVEILSAEDTPEQGSMANLSPYPKSCAACHAGRFADWSNSLHAQSVSPGLLTQLDIKHDPKMAEACYYCHAPASVQNEALGSMSEFAPNPYFDQPLMDSGVSCAICHMRDGVIVGPKEAATSAKDIKAKKGHQSRKGSIFKSAEFCAACHQMDAGFELNGKVLTNTYNEWKESSYGENNITCQSCHMPRGEHLFRGIHDKDMVLKGLDIKILRVPAMGSGGIKAALMIKNARVGHMFPTYVTPIVVVKAFLTGKDGVRLEESEEKIFIGRLVSQGLDREYFDTRLAPFETMKLDYDRADTSDAERLVFEVWVRPDEFYDRLFKRATEANAPGFNSAELARALKRTESSTYLLFREEIKI